MSSFDILILGAGIVGCACASEGTRAGLRVGVIECGVPGGATTAAGMGHIVLMDGSSAQLKLTRYSRSLWQAIQPQLSPAVEYETRGTLWVASNEEEMAEVRAKQNTYSSIGVASTVLDSGALGRDEPNLRPGLAGGLLVPDDGVIYPPAAAAYFLEDAIRGGAVLLRGQAAVGIGNGEVRLSDGSVHSAGHIVVATGIATDLLPWIPVQRRKGHLLITDRHPGFLSHQLLELGYLKSAHKLTADSVAFNIQPRRTGQLLIGSSRQYGNEDTSADPGIVRRMLERACEYMPGLARVSGLRVWTGFRAETPDKLPLIGPTEDPTVLLAMGFEGLGITNATGAARLVFDHLLGRESEIDPTPYLPARVVRDVVTYA